MIDIFALADLPSSLCVPPSKPEEGRIIRAWAEVDLAAPISVRVNKRTTTFQPIKGTLESSKASIETMIKASIHPSSKYVVWQAHKACND
jgi:hypothetical protein